MLTEKDINIFTIVKDKNTISPLRQWCIDSWKKCMPEANIMIFDDSDLNNPNWKYYDVIKNDKLFNISLHNDTIKREKILVTYLNQFTGGLHELEFVNSLLCNVSTDCIRLKLLYNIPNALYLDSDTFMTESLLRYCNEYPEFINDPYGYVGKYGGVNTCFGLFSKNKSEFIEKLIEFYDENYDRYRFYYDDAAMVSCVRKLNRNISDMGVSVINMRNNAGNESLVHLHLSSTERYGLHITDKSKKLIKVYYTFKEVLKLSGEEKTKLETLLMWKFNELSKQGQDLIYLISADGENVFQIFDNHFDISKIRIYCYTQLFDEEFLKRLKPEIIEQTKKYIKENDKCYFRDSYCLSDIDNVEFQELIF